MVCRGAAGWYHPAMIRFAPIAFLLVAAASAAADPSLGVGDRLVPLVLADQHDAEVRVAEEARILLFARDMAGGDIAEAALAEGGAALLREAGAVFVSDISRMPGLITRLFALPAMRRRDYPMVLDRDGSATAALPHRDGRLTVLRLDALKIETVDFVDSGDAVRALLAAAAVPADAR